MLELAIVGAGPAGISTALHLQAVAPRLAERSLVLEAARLPRPKCCAGVLAGRGDRLLERIGIVLDVPAAPVHRLALSFVDGEVTVAVPGMARVVRRTELDQALVREARRRGIEIREEARVVGLEAETAAGVRLRLASGETVRARVVVGADGAASVVRRTAGIGGGWLLARAAEVVTPRRPALDPPPDTLHFDFRDLALPGYAWDFPAGGAPELAGRGVYLVRQGRGRTDPRAALLGRLARQGITSPDLSVGQAAQRGLQPASPLSRPRVLLVGEAAGVDIFTGEGIPQALAYGALAGPYLAERLARDDLGFADWLTRVRASELGRRLRMLHAAQAIHAGPRRRAMERIIRGGPDVLRTWVLGFAGQPTRPVRWGRVLRQAAPLLLTERWTMLRAIQALLFPP